MLTWASSTTPQTKVERIEGAIKALKEEGKAAVNADLRALLAHEAGVLHWELEQLAESTHEFLVATRAAPGFAEPLERLIELSSRRRISRSLRQLLSQRCELATTAAQRAHANGLMACHLLTASHDADGAREFAQLAVQASPTDPGAWLLLQLLGSLLGDQRLQLTALEKRAKLADHPLHASLLWTDLAERHAEGAEPDLAKAALRAAIAAAGSEGLLSLHKSQERIARRVADREAIIDSLVQQAELIVKAASPVVDAPLSVPPPSQDAPAYAVAPEHKLESAVERLLRAAFIAEPARAQSLLTRAAELAPRDRLVSEFRLENAQRQADHFTVVELAEWELSHDPSPTVASALWVRIAQAKLKQQHPQGALEAAQNALRLDPSSSLAWAIELELLTEQDPERLAERYDMLASLQQGEDRVDTLLLSAFLFAYRNRDFEAAQATVRKALGFGLSPVSCWHFWGMLQRLSAAQETATSLPALLPEGPERLSQELARWRTRMALGHMESGTEALRRSRPGAWLLDAVAAYRPLMLGLSERRSHAALERLAEGSEQPQLAEAWRIAALAREQRSAGFEAEPSSKPPSTRSPQTTLAKIRKLSDAHPDDLLLCSWFVQGAENASDPRALAEALPRLAQASSEPSWRRAARVRAFLSAWRSNNLEAALGELQLAADEALVPHQWLAWALYASRAPAVEARVRVLQYFSPELGPLAELEASGLGQSGAPRQAQASASASHEGAASGARMETSSPAPAGIRLALHWWSMLQSPVDSSARAEARDQIRPETPAARSLLALTGYYDALRRGEAPEGALPLLEDWAHAEPHAVSALEWAAAAERVGDGHARADAELLLSRCLHPDLALPLRVQTKLRRALQSDEAQPLELDLAEQGLRPGDPTYHVAQLGNLELAPPGRLPARRAAVLSSCLPDTDDQSRSASELLLAYNLVWSGQHEHALTIFRKILEVHPDDANAWEGMHAVAQQSAQPELLVEACEALARLEPSSEHAAGYYETAGLAALNDLADEPRGEALLEQAVRLDITRPRAFDRLFRLVRARGDRTRLLALIGARLTVADDPLELTKLYWERARTLREAGETRAALEAIKHVQLLDAEHMGAKALTAEIAIAHGNFLEAAATLAGLALADTTPRKQRVMSGVAAADLFESKLDRPASALPLLQSLASLAPGDLGIQERLARVAAATEAWETAVRALQRLAEERGTAAGRAAAARLGLAIYRDKLLAPEQAQAVARTLLEHQPGDSEAIDFLLDHPSVLSHDWQPGAIAHQLEALGRTPLDVTSMARLARLSQLANSPALEQITLSGLVCLGHFDDRIRQRLAALDRAQQRVPLIRFADPLLDEVLCAGDGGPLAQLLRAMAVHYAKALGPDLDTLHVHRGDRVRAGSGLPVHQELAAWLGAFGIAQFDLYVGGRDPRGVIALASEVPSIILGAQVSAPFSPEVRAKVAREAFGLWRGNTLLYRHPLNNLAAILSATARVLGQDPSGPQLAMTDQFAHQLQATLPRKQRKALRGFAEQLPDLLPSLEPFVRAALGSSDRIMALATGDVAASVQSAGAMRQSHTEHQEARVANLMSYCLSPRFFSLRAQLGLGLR